MRGWRVHRIEGDGDLRWARRLPLDPLAQDPAPGFLCESVSSDGLLRAGVVLGRLRPDEADVFRAVAPDRSAIDLAVVAGSGEAFVLVGSSRPHSSGLGRLAFVYSALARSRDAALFCDAAGTILGASRRWRELYGYSSCEVLGRNPRLVSSNRHARSFFRHLWLALRDRRSDSWSGELVNRRCNGDLVRVWQTITTFRDARAGIAGYLGLTRDLSERGDFLASQRQRLENAERDVQSERSRLAATARELRSPLAAIVGFSELAERLAAPHERSSVLPHLDAMRRAATRLETLVAELQQPSPPGSNPAEDVSSRFRLRALARVEIALQASLARHRGISLELVEEGLSLPCIGHEAQLATAVRDLASFAARQARPGSTVSIRIATEEDGCQRLELSFPEPGRHPAPAADPDLPPAPPPVDQRADSDWSLDRIRQIAELHRGSFELDTVEGRRSLVLRVPFGWNQLSDRIWAVAVLDPREHLWPWLEPVFAAAEIPAYLVHGERQLAALCRVELPNLVLAAAEDGEIEIDEATFRAYVGTHPTQVWLTPGNAGKSGSVVRSQGAPGLIAELSTLLASGEASARPTEPEEDAIN